MCLLLRQCLGQYLQDFPVTIATRNLKLRILMDSINSRDLFNDIMLNCKKLSLHVFLKETPLLGLGISYLKKFNFYEFLV